MRKDGLKRNAETVFPHRSDCDTVAEYIAAYYHDSGRLTDLNGARKDAVRICRKHGNRIMCYINKDMLGNPWGVVFKEGKHWIWEPRWTSGRYIINPDTGRTVRKK